MSWGLGAGRPLRRRMAWILALGAGLLAFACGGTPSNQTPTPTATTSAQDDRVGPSIYAPPIPDGQARGVDVVVDATIADPSGVAFAAIYYRVKGTDYWASGAFVEQGGDAFQATIPGSWVGEGGIEWYIEARDATYHRNTSLYPPAGAVTPLYFSAQSPPQPFPFRESFEPEDPDATRYLLGESGWTGYVRGFYDTENWLLAQGSASDGAWAARHGHGSPYQADAFEDWLVSPPIDLSLAETADLSWMELVDHPEYADHRILVSVGSPDPEDGDYIPVLEGVPVASGPGWQPSVHVDLTAFAGAPQAFVAFVYEGLWADDWLIDEVVVDVQAPDLAVSDPVFDPPSVRPGDTAALGFTVINRGLAASGPVSVQILGDDPLVQITPAETSLAAVALGGQVDAGPFLIQVDAGHANHTFVPLTLRLSDGAWTFEEEVRLQVGRPPMAFIQITHAYQNDIELAIGYERDGVRAFYRVIQADGGADEAGVFTWSIDLWDERDAFPPDTTTQRWFVEAADDSVGNTGTLDQFYLAEAEQVYVSDGLPRAIPDDGSALDAWIPGRAELDLAELTIDPPLVTPGAAVTLSVSAYNRGAPPRGPLTGTLRTSEPDILDLDGGPISYAYAVLSGDGDLNGLASPLAPFTFTVSPEHQSSAPLRLTLLLTDGVDNWTLPLTVDVPWPVLSEPSVLVADDEVDGAFEDYGLSPTEATALRILTANVGGRSTFAPVMASVRVIDDGGAGVTIPETAYLVTPESGEGGASGLNPAGRGRSGLIPVDIEGGGLETEVVLEVTVSDGTVSRTVTRTLPMLAPPYNPLLPLADDGADSLGVTDLVDGRWRQFEDVLWVRWESAGPMDLGQTLLYALISTDRNYRYALAWAYGEPALFRWVTSTGVGYWSRSVLPPGSFQIYPVDARHLEAVVDLNELSMAGRDLYGGAGAGACGAGFCDVAPDSAAASTGGLTPFKW